MGDFGLTEYLNQMSYLALRINAIHLVLTGKYTTPYPFTNIEFTVLQIRKIIEHIAMGNLIANKELYSKYNSRFAHDWNARSIFTDIERINPKYYPEPIKIDKSNEHDEFLPFTEIYMTKDDAISIYQKCGALMHVANPYGSQIDIEYYEDKVKEWYKNIINLTNRHIIHMVDGERMFFIVMKSERDGKPAGNLFQKI
jgi:hypothetical protein